jgi:hypothetical protein
LASTGTFRHGSFFSEEITKLKEAVQKKERQLLLELDSKATVEKKVHQVQIQLDQSNIDTTKLKLKIEELRLKYEPGEYEECHQGYDLKIILLLMQSC